MIIKIDTKLSAPIYEQLRDQIIIGIADGRLVPDEPLPSIRRLAADLGINLHTVNKTYAILCEQGYIKMDRRKGAVVAQPKKGQNFLENLQSQLKIISAEAVCNNISEEEYISHCISAYKEAQGKIGGKNNE